jgi:hypothetical protein
MLTTVRQKPWQKTQLWGLYKTQDGSSSEASGSGETPLQCVNTEPVVGDGCDVRAHLDRGGVCVFHHRCVLKEHRRLEGCQSHADRNCVGCDRDGEMVQGATITWFAMP